MIRPIRLISNFMQKTVLFLFLLVLILLLRFVFFYSSKHEYKVGDDIVLRYTFLKEPQRFFGKQIFSASGLQITTPDTPEFKYGDTVIIKGTVTEASFISKKNTLIRKLVVVNPEIEIEKDSFGLSLLSGMRTQISSVFQKTLSKNESALLIGIVFGIRQGMDKELMDALRNVGVLHVIAASGANVSMVGGFLLVFFGAFLKRQTAVVCACLAILFYALFSGFEASIARAALMAIVAYSATIFGRQNYPLIKITLVAFFMLFLNPMLFEDIGFQLSFASTLGIVYLKPILSLILNKPQVIIDDLTTTLSAQAASLPILVTSFSSYSPISIPINAFVLWTIPPLMILGGLGALLSLILPFLAAPVLFLALPLLLFFEKAVVFGNSLAKPVEIASTPLSMIIGYYLVLVGLVLLIKNRFKNKDSRFKNSKS